MAFTDPQSITISGTTYVLPRTVTEPRKAIYADSTNTIRLTPSQVTNGRLSHVLTLGQSKTVTDPNTGLDRQVAMSSQLSIVRPLVGFTTADVIAHLTGLVTYLSASSYANSIKWVDGQS